MGTRHSRMIDQCEGEKPQGFAKGAWPCVTGGRGYRLEPVLLGYLEAAEVRGLGRWSASAAILKASLPSLCCARYSRQALTTSLMG
jgi:hypothetical protein